MHLQVVNGRGDLGLIFTSDYLECHKIRTRSRRAHQTPFNFAQFRVKRVAINLTLCLLILWRILLLDIVIENHFTNVKDVDEKRY